MQGFHHPHRRFCEGWPICITWYPPGVASSMPGSVGWQWQEAPSPHAPGSSISKSSPPGDFAMR